MSHLAVEYQSHELGTWHQMLGAELRQRSVTFDTILSSRLHQKIFSFNQNTKDSTYKFQNKWLSHQSLCMFVGVHHLKGISQHRWVEE
jgi:hypothetical protein